MRNYENESGGNLYTCPADTIGKGFVSEKLIYDFSVEEGNIVSLYSFIMQGGSWESFKVIETGYKDIAGEECKAITVAYLDNFDNDDIEGGNVVVEGIGTTYYGCLNYTEHIAIPAGFWYYNYLNRVFDMEGKVIFESAGGAVHKNLHYGPFSRVAQVDDNNKLRFSTFSISFGQSGERNTINVFDLNGMPVISCAGVGPQTLSTENLSPGVYVAVGGAEGKPAVRRKFVVK